MKDQDQRIGLAIDPTHGKPIDADLLKTWDAQHSWHPFTPMRQYLESDPLLIVQGNGVWLQATDGRWYLDGCSSIWLNIHGHRHPYLDMAIQRQLGQVAHVTMLGQANVPATILAKRLTDVVPAGLTRCHFSDCGATAVEIAVKTAIQYWHNLGHPQKTQIIGFSNNYHGDTLGAMAVAPSPFFHAPFLSLLPLNHQLDYPVCADQPLPAAGAECDPLLGQPLDQYLTAQREQVAAVIIEPVQGAGGILPAPPGFLRRLKQICQAHQVLLIVDEVATGFGHTGDWFACTTEQVSPDILCLGKGLSGGYLPMAATLTSEAIYEAFLGEIAEQRTLYHGHSFAGNPLAAAVSLASLDLMPKLLTTLEAKVRLMHEALGPLNRHPHVWQIRQRGLMVGITVCRRREPGGRFAVGQRAGYVVANHARELGLILRPIGDVVIVMPPPSITLAELQDLLDRLCQAFERARQTWTADSQSA
jgi:adenosylmethionine---8-amino-7-oxononanoate aminotransferase